VSRVNFAKPIQIFCLFKHWWTDNKKMGGLFSSEEVPQEVLQAEFEGKQLLTVPHEAKCLLWLDQTTLAFSLVLGDENYLHIRDLKRNNAFQCKTAMPISHLVLLDNNTFAAMTETQVDIMTKSGEIVKSIPKSVWEFTAMARAEKGCVVVSTSQNAVLIYSKSGELQESSFHQERITALAPYGDRVVAGYDTGIIRVWLLGHELEVFSCDGSLVTSLAVVDSLLFAGSLDGKIRLWDIFGDVFLREFDGHNGPISQLVLFGSHCCRLASASHDGTVRVWDIDTGECVILDASKRGGPVVALAAVGNQLASCERGGHITVWK